MQKLKMLLCSKIVFRLTKTLSLFWLLLTETSGCEQNILLIMDFPCLRLSLRSNKYYDVYHLHSNELFSDELHFLIVPVTTYTTTAQTTTRLQVL